MNCFISVPECKEKWKNIRGSLLRSLKPSEKTKKPYYLTSYLTFVMPFLKPLTSLELKEDIYNTSNNMGSISKDNELLIHYDAVKSEEDSESDLVTEDRYNEVQNDDLCQPESQFTRKRKMQSDNRSRKRRTEEPDSINQNVYSLTQDAPRTNIESMHYFLMSLIQDFETMSDEQMRLFKIKVMLLINDIKSDHDKVQQTVTSATETERLNKRLVNLLIKNLEKNT